MDGTAHSINFFFAALIGTTIHGLLKGQLDGAVAKNCRFVRLFVCLFVCLFTFSIHSRVAFFFILFNRFDTLKR